MAGTPWSSSTTPDLKILDLAAERVAQHDQLDQRHDNGDHHQNRAAPEAAQIAFKKKATQDAVLKARDLKEEVRTCSSKSQKEQEEKLGALFKDGNRVGCHQTVFNAGGGNKVGAISSNK